MEWKRIVRYMYEYENERKVRNVGFVRFDINNRICKAYIHGKGIHAEDTCNIYAFYENGDAIVRIPLGYVRMKNGNLEGYVELNCEHVGETQRTFDEIIGLMIGENRKRRYLVFLQNERPLDKVQDSVQEEETVIDSEIEEIIENDLEESEIVESAPKEIEVEELEFEPTDKENNQDETDGIEDDTQELPPESETIVEEQFQYKKVGPRDLRVLRKQDRHLANNSFLLHGYYNYQHLLLVEEEEYNILGVPGVYMEREKRAAIAFGFPDFIEAEEYGISVPFEINEQKAVFGYWCRHLKKE